MDDAYFVVLSHREHFGSIFYACDLLSPEKIDEIESQGSGAPLFFYLPQPCEERNNQICLPIIWQTSNDTPKYEVDIELYQNFLDTHHDHFRDELKTTRVQQFYEPKILNQINKIMQKYRKETNNNIHNVKSGDLVQLDPDEVKFAEEFQYAKVCQIRKRDWQKNIKIIHLKTDNDKQELIPIIKSGGYIGSSAIKNVVCRHVDPILQWQSIQNLQNLDEIIIQNNDDNQNMDVDMKNNDIENNELQIDIILFEDITSPYFLNTDKYYEDQSMFAIYSQMNLNDYKLVIINELDYILNKTVNQCTQSTSNTLVKHNATKKNLQRFGVYCSPLRFQYQYIPYLKSKRIVFTYSNECISFTLESSSLMNILNRSNVIKVTSNGGKFFLVADITYKYVRQSFEILIQSYSYSHKNRHEL